MSLQRLRPHAVLGGHGVLVLLLEADKAVVPAQRRRPQPHCLGQRVLLLLVGDGAVVLVVLVAGAELQLALEVALPQVLRLQVVRDVGDRVGQDAVQQ